MTISQYLKNPYGKGSSFAPARKQIEDLEKQFRELQDKIISKIYKYRDYVIYHVVIPSYTRDDVTYDVIVEVQLQNLHEGAATVEDLDFKVFSNCPSFIFTYANVFHSNKLLCDWLMNKYNAEVKKNLPIYRNRYGVIGFERSLYLTFRYLHVFNRTSLAVIQTAGIKLGNRNIIINSVRSQEQIMDKVKSKIKKDPKQKVTKTGKEDPAFGSKSISTKKSNTISVTPTIKNSKNVKSSKKSKNIKKTRKI